MSVEQTTKNNQSQGYEQLPKESETKDINETNYGKPEFEEIRKTLLNQYHTHVTTHTGLIIAIIIGSLTLLSRWDSFFSDPSPLVIFYLTFSFIVGLTFYVIGRLSYWASISNSILIMTEKEFNDYHRLHADRPCICSAQVKAEEMTRTNKNEALHYVLSRLTVTKLLLYSGFLGILTYLALTGLTIWLQLPSSFSFFK